MIEREREVYERLYANVHRGVHRLSQLSSDAYEKARGVVRRFVNAAEAREVVFVQGATEAVNLVAQTHGRKNVGAGDEVLITGLGTTRTSCRGSSSARRRGRRCG
ncbi:MAG: aminotransferase class V-fold PLP-dependent enzyme [Vicinamibacteria bacterium]